MDGGSPDVRGVSEKEAAARLKAEGPNTLPQADRRSFVGIALEILREPMFALLVGAAVIYLVLGDLREAVVLGIFAFLRAPRSLSPSFRNSAPNGCSKACAI